MTTEALLVVVVALVLAIAAPGTYWLYVAFTAMREQLEEMRAEQGNQRAEVDRLRWELNLEREYSRALGRAFLEATGVEPPPPPNRVPLILRRPGISGAALSQKIAGKFSLSEINDLALELGLENVLTGESEEQRASSLVKAALRRDLLSQLVEACRRQRPSAGF